MTQLLNYFIIMPLLAYLVSLMVPRKNEPLMSGIAFTSIGIHLVSFIVFFVLWINNGHPTLNLKDLVVYKSTGYEFFIDFCFDKITAVYVLRWFLISIYGNFGSKNKQIRGFLAACGARVVSGLPRGVW